MIHVTVLTYTPLYTTQLCIVIFLHNSCSCQNKDIETEKITLVSKSHNGCCNFSQACRRGISGIKS